jgi:hypothetical protein
MNAELAVVLALLVAAVAMFVINKPRMDAVALIMLTALPFTGVVSMGETLAGFSDSNIVLIAALFVIGEGLVRTGRGPTAGRLARRQGRQQRNPAARPADAGGRYPRLDHEFDRRDRHLHSGRAAHRPKHRHAGEPADDADERGRADQRHDDAGGDRAQPGRQQRARAGRRGRLSLLQLHTLWYPDSCLGHRLHALRAPLARRRVRRWNPGRFPAQPA